VVFVNAAAHRHLHRVLCFGRHLLLLQIPKVFYVAVIATHVDRDIPFQACVTDVASTVVLLVVRVPRGVPDRRNHAILSQFF